MRKVGKIYWPCNLNGTADQDNMHSQMWICSDSRAKLAALFIQIDAGIQIMMTLLKCGVLLMFGPNVALQTVNGHSPLSTKGSHDSPLQDGNIPALYSRWSDYTHQFAPSSIRPAISQDRGHDGHLTQGCAPAVRVTAVMTQKFVRILWRQCCCINLQESELFLVALVVLVALRSF
jgi:hypothetical protein